jgi:hypothetical protein
MACLACPANALPACHSHTVPHHAPQLPQPARLASTGQRLVKLVSVRGWTTAGSLMRRIASTGCHLPAQQAAARMRLGMRLGSWHPGKNPPHALQCYHPALPASTAQPLMLTVKVSP